MTDGAQNMRYYSVEAEAPGAGYGPTARLRYGPEMRYIEEVGYLDLEFLVWSGGDLIQDVGQFCVTSELWGFLRSNSVKGVYTREMTVTIGNDFHELCPGVSVPRFEELVLPRQASATKQDKWILDAKTIPDAEMFTGIGLPLFVNHRIKDLFEKYGVKGLRFDDAIVA